jgi:predicted enzyme related to lactoylglutathione lyase
MGGYADYSMVDAETGEARAGVCHARGVNQDLPPVWLLYITVADLASAVTRAQALGGAVLKAPAKMGAGWYAVVRDPAGAAVALYEAPEA